MTEQDAVPGQHLRSKVNANLATGPDPGRTLDVAVVGAGVSGLYTGYRLLSAADEADVDLASSRVGVFDLNDRIGGRLESVVLPGMDFAGELGGMRYMKSQKIVKTLVEDVFDRLTHRTFPMGDPANHLRYFRKQRFTADQWTGSSTVDVPYHLDGDDAGLSPDQLFDKIVYDVLMGDQWFADHYGGKVHKHSRWQYEFDLDRRDWNEVKPKLTYELEGPYYGERLADLGFWNVIEDRASHEGYQFLADAGGYYSNTLNWNAAEAFPYMVGDFAGTPHYRTIEGGYDLLAYAMAERILAAGATIRVQNRLETFSRNSGAGPRYELTFADERGGRRWTATANRIVLAMPRHSLELLDQDNFFFDRDRRPQLHHNVESVINEPAYKLLVGFEFPWWRESPLGAKHGESITDLPMRQCYYFGVDEGDSHSLFLASYNDMRTVPFWEVLEGLPAGVGDDGLGVGDEDLDGGDGERFERRDVERFEPRATDLADADDLAELQPHQAPQAMVDEAMRQVAELHGLSPTQLPDPYVTYYKDWSEDPYGGGYHAWKAGYPVRKVMRYMRKPLADETVYVCGEAYSDQQGWVEGALCVAERMLEEHFGMPRPGWLPGNYYLGW